MLSHIRGSFLIGVVMMLPSLLAAQSWQFVGTRAMGMGGAGVATAYGPDAQYWNPAGLAQEEDVNESGFLLSGAGSLEATKNVLEGIRDLSDMSDQYRNLSHAISNGQYVSAENISTIFKGLNDISDLIGQNMGALVNANAGAGIKIKNFALSARALGTGSILPVVDTRNISFNLSGSGLQLGDAGDPSSVNNQQSASQLADSIQENNLFNALNSLLGGIYTDAQALANAIINAAVTYGATETQIAQAINTATQNMAGAAPILEYASTSTGSYADNETLAMADAATFAEVALGYGSEVGPGLKLGINIKGISGYTAQSGVMVLTDHEKIEDIFDKAYDNKKNSTNIGVDVGLLANFSRIADREIWGNPQLGITARNINGPKFARPDVPTDVNAAIAAQWRTDKYQLKPQVRAGMSLNPLRWMTVAADIDVTENETLLDSVKSRQLAVGMEFNLINTQMFNIPLRLGYNKNLASEDVSPFFTAGVGFNMAHFYLELSGAMSSKTTKIDGHDIPNSAAAALTLGVLF